MKTLYAGGYTLGMVLVIFLLCIGCSGFLASKPESKGFFCYAIRTLPNHGGDVLSKINVQTGTIEKEIPLKHWYSYMALLPDKRVILCCSRDGDFGYKKFVDCYDPKKNRISRFANTKYDDPAFAYGDGQHVCVVEGCYHSDELNLEIFGLHGERQKSILLHPTSMMFADAITPVFCKGQLSQLVMVNREFGKRAERPDKEAFVFWLNTQSQICHKQDVDLNRYFASVTGLVLDRERQMIYMGADLKFNDDAHPDPKDANTSICLFSYPDFAFKKRIELGKQPKRMVAVPEDHKIYVNQMKSISVIDTRTQTRIRKLPIQSINISYLGKSILCINAQEDTLIRLPSGTLTIKPGPENLIFLNTKTDQIIRKIPGNFSTLSVDLNAQK